MKTMFKSWRIHNYVGHPLSQLCSDIGRMLDKVMPEHSVGNTIFHAFTGQTFQGYLDKVGDKIHNGTLP